MCHCLSSAPYWGPGPQPRHTPWLGIKPATLSFAGLHSFWAIPARAEVHVMGNLDIHTRTVIFWSPSVRQAGSWASKKNVPVCPLLRYPVNKCFGNPSRFSRWAIYIGASQRSLRKSTTLLAIFTLLPFPPSFPSLRFYQVLTQNQVTVKKRMSKLGG